MTFLLQNSMIDFTFYQYKIKPLVGHLNLIGMKMLTGFK